MGYIVPAPPFVDPKATVVAKAANATLTAAECNGSNVTNTGAGAGITLTLPAASAAAGCAFRVQVTVAQTVTLDPGTGKIFLGGSGVAEKTAIIAGVIGNTAVIYSDGIDWAIRDYSGTVTKQA